VWILCTSCRSPKSSELGAKGNTLAEVILSEYELQVMIYEKLRRFYVEQWSTIDKFANYGRTLCLSIILVAK
jgi:hypothetical protein